ncbi:glycoside hydrolase family 16 protein [Christiangramia sp. SM2212]|uniref:Glycoside hydrolase family 16 protein n=1 Tax=Christiangramia sediminicola TaxID=3073267 RepID=A0ABU1EPY1_9FLAO|nr:glycoside hydrolase family 16 protein [Christiangramia sp. SM2212]MDR5590450.1 glycoside hydrolase family 16 protein [Christiangramia sp. SM2212]
MNKYLPFSLIILFLFITTAMKSQHYELIWHDDFNESGKPDPEKWNYETGFIRNLEEQIYTKRKKNVRIKNGKLELIARKENFKNKRYDPDVRNYRINTETAEYTSGSITTKDKFEFKYGRVEVRAKLPDGNGVWPAIWMLGANFEEIEYPYAGEIDIMEHVGKTPNEIHGTVHFPWDNAQGITSDGGTTEVASPSEEYHVYSVSWSSEKIEFLVDNSVYHTFEADKAGRKNNPFRKPFYLILNLALGGNWAGEIDTAIFPQKFLIDYVRVYKEIE